MFSLVNSNTRSNFPLSNKKIIKKTLEYSVKLPFLLVFIQIIWIPLVPIIENYIAEAIALIIILNILLLIILIVWKFIYETWYFNTYYYELTDNFVQIKKGVFSTKEITIPHERIQDVYVDQDIIDRVFGLYDVHLSSATMSSSWLAHIDGVEQSAAEGLKSALLEKLHQKQNNGSSTI